MSPCGEEHPKARHSDDDVDLCRQLYEAGVTPLAIARKMEICRWTVVDWVYYRTRTGVQAERRAQRRRA